MIRLSRLCITVLVILCSFSVYSQTEISLIAVAEDLGNEARTLITTSLSQTNLRTAVVHITGITRSGHATELGRLFSFEAADQLANAGSPSITSTIDPSGVTSANYRLSGEAFLEESSVTVYLQLTRIEGQEIIGSRKITLNNSPNLSTALSAPAAGGIGDIFEPDNSPGEASSLLVGTPVTGHTISPAGDEDWFVIDLPQSEAGTIEVLLRIQTLTKEGEDIVDTYIELYDSPSAEYIIAENDDGDSANADLKTIVTPGGRYYAKVFGYDDTVNGPYDIIATIQEASYDRYEPNNDLNSATMVSLNSRTEGLNIMPGGESDWFEIIVSRSEVISSAVMARTHGNLDTMVTVYDAFGIQLLQDDDSGGDGNGRVVFFPENPGSYYVQVTGYDDSVLGDYSLEIRTVEAQRDAYESDDSILQAKEIRPGETQSRSFFPDTDIDWIKLTISSRSRYVIETSGTADTYLALYDSSEALLTEDDDSGTDYNAKLDLTLDPGTYYIEASMIYESDSLYSDYSLSVR